MGTPSPDPIAVLIAAGIARRGTADQFEIWNGQIVIPNVKVQRPTPTTRGSTAPSVP
jgi:hypothetical protein